MGLMGFGAMLLLSCAGWTDAGSPGLFAALMVASGALIVLGRYVEGVSSHAGAYRLLASMRIHLFESIRRLAPACLMDRKKGDLLNIAVSDIETVEFFFAHTIGPLFTVVLLPVTTLVLALCIHPLFAAVLLPVYLVISVGFPLLALKIGRPVGLKYRERLGEMKALVLESVYGIKDIQIFGHGAARLARVQAQNRRINRAAHGLTIHRQTVASAPTFFVYLARILLLAVATYLAANGAQNPGGHGGDLLCGHGLLLLDVLADDGDLQPAGDVCCGRAPLCHRGHRARGRRGRAPEKDRRDPRDRLRRRGLFLPRGRGADPARLLFDGPQGRLGRHRGRERRGKSTILRLLLRFWNPTGGDIRLNGVPIGETDLGELRGRIAMLEQDTLLINASIADNIALGKPDATREEIRGAARRAGLDDFIQTLPEGYDTQMGQMSARLSGGRAPARGHRARAAADPDVVVMDEPTSSLDVLHEKELLKTLREQYRGKTLLLISHRLSTLADCTRIVRLEQGRAVEETPQRG